MLGRRSDGRATRDARAEASRQSRKEPVTCSRPLLGMASHLHTHDRVLIMIAIFQNGWLPTRGARYCLVGANRCGIAWSCLLDIRQKSRPALIGRINWILAGDAG